MSPSISSSKVGSTEVTLGGRESDFSLLGRQVRSWLGVVELNTSWRQVQRLSQDSPLNFDPLLSTRFSRQEMPDLASCSLSCWMHHWSWANRSLSRRGETTAKY